uniref:Isoleucine--tRNA ligase n=1 Tax=candidate division WOR-3 bacterium TaxID=2052148 RepID=A0A7C4UF22_UNCW3
MNYKNTINLPKTEFQMKADLIRKEPLILKKWEEMKIYEKMVSKRKKNKKFVLHDGPPYSNGNIHLGQALNKILKDAINKFYSLKGYYTPFVPGWDNHGMPIERKVVEEVGKDKDPILIRKKCREFASKWVKIQMEEFKRLGVFADWDNPYLTMNPSYESKELELFADIVKKGFVYRGFMPVHWCPVCETALALSEIEYKILPSPSIYFTMEGKDFDALVWTTTPWTIISNVALAVNPHINYVVGEKNGRKYLFAEALFDTIVQKINFEGIKVVKKFRGSELEGMIFKHPFIDRNSPMILGDFVSTDEGTGIVHIAPGHGREDYEVGKNYNLQVLSPVDEKGRFTDEAPDFKGLSTDEASIKVTEILKNNGRLLLSETIEHSYPRCWRCKTPLIFRATDQWFLSVDHNNLREKALKEIEKVRWHPEESINRIYASVKERPDWCLSRQRIWGVNIPAFYCENCGEVLLEPDLIKFVAERFKEKNSDIWFEEPVERLLPEGTKCPKCGSDKFRKETDILDVWFDSGISSIVVLDENEWPSEVYLEGPDQHRGWFNSSLMVSMILKDKPPYKNVITHGWVLDEEYRTMHKSLGNVISPDEIVKKYGAEILRLWALSIEYTQDVRLGDEILQRLVDSYRKIRNTIRFMLGNTDDFDENIKINEEDLFPQDRFILLKFEMLLKEVEKDYGEFLFYKVYRNILNFITDELSSFYLDILKDRLYTWGKNSKGRRSAQFVLYSILRRILVILSPMLSFTAEEAYGFIKGKKEESVFLEDFPSGRELNEDEKEFIQEFGRILKIREEIQKPMESARRDGFIGNSLEAKIIINGDKDLLNKYISYLPEIFIVSKVEIMENPEGKYKFKGEYGEYAVDRAEGKKCERCWVYSESVGNDAEHPTLCSKCSDVIRRKDYESE